MKKLLLGALLVIGSMSYGAMSGNVDPVVINITANVVGSGSIAVTGEHLQGTALTYNGEEEVLNVAFTGEHVTFNELSVSLEPVIMTNGTSAENFTIGVATNGTNTVTLQSHNMTDVMAGDYTGTISIGAIYN